MLKEEIREILNRNSRENMSDTPDFILAQYLIDCLVAFESAMQTRDSWYGKGGRYYKWNEPIENTMYICDADAERIYTKMKAELSLICNADAEKHKNKGRIISQHTRTTIAS